MRKSSSCAAFSTDSATCPFFTICDSHLLFCHFLDGFSIKADQQIKPVWVQVRFDPIVEGKDFSMGGM